MLLVSRDENVATSEKTSISAILVVGIFIYIRSTMPDRRKVNPGFTNSPFKVGKRQIKRARARTRGRGRMIEKERKLKKIKGRKNRLSGSIDRWTDG